MNSDAFNIIKATKNYVQDSLETINSLKEGLQDFERLKKVLEEHTIKSFFESRPEIKNFTWKYLDRPDGTIRIGRIDRYEWVLLAYDGSLCVSLDKDKILKSTALNFIYGAIFGIGHGRPMFYFNELCFLDSFKESRKNSGFFNKNEHSLEIMMDETDINNKMMCGLITTPELEDLLNDCKSTLNRKRGEFNDFVEKLRSELQP